MYFAAVETIDIRLRMSNTGDFQSSSGMANCLDTYSKRNRIGEIGQMAKWKGPWGHCIIVLSN